VALRVWTPQTDLASSVSVVEILDEHGSGALSNRRWVIGLADGSAVEAVLYRGDSLCISSQVGCAVGCPFCASGAKGFGRNLSLDELEGQVEAVRARVGAGAVARVTVSGVGEPLHNHRVVARFVESGRARGLPISITTSGGPLERLREWFELPHNGISLSIHAGSEAVRARTVPRGPALGPLFELLDETVPRLTSSRRRKLALAYLLLDGLNDDDDEIAAFLARALPLGLKVHLYRYNPVPTSSQATTQDERYQAVFARMVAAGLDVRRSSQARIEPNGGCGTLVALRASNPRSL
jgi:23S rRNA (adenine2503-C2)-methyltransferase